ncbi:2450_t:CDS:1, partial [Funneliformis caledonium]
MKFTTTKFAITIFVLLAYVAIITQAIGIKNGGGYLTEFQAKHAMLMDNLKDTIKELDHRME